MDIDSKMPSSHLDRTSWSQRTQKSNMFEGWSSSAQIRTKSSDHYERCATRVYEVEWWNFEWNGVSTDDHSRISSRDLNDYVTFSTRWSRHVGGKVPPKRDVMLEKIASWRKLVPDLVLGLPKAALSMMELILMCSDPAIKANDYWVQYFTDGAVIWIPVYHCRMLPTNVLLSLSRSALGTRYWMKWIGGKCEELSLTILTSCQ